MILGGVRLVGSIVLALLVGVGIGNFMATRRALEEQRVALLAYASDREASVAAAYRKANMEFSERLRIEQARRDAADAYAHGTYQEALVSAAKDKAEADRVIAAAIAEKRSQEETNDGLRMVNGMLADAARRAGACSFDPDVRRVLDAAAGASGSGGADAADGAAAVASSGTPATSATGAALTCGQLLRGYRALATDRRELAGQLRAVLDWEERVR
jgi:hypothetical protein